MRQRHYGALAVLLAIVIPCTAQGEDAQVAPSQVRLFNGALALRLCTGSKGEVYNRIGEALRKRVDEALVVKVEETRGSWRNSELMAGELRYCDAMVAQADVVALYKRDQRRAKLRASLVETLYPEYVHVACNRKVKARSVSELRPGKDRVLVDVRGSGTYLTWDFFSRLNGRYRAMNAKQASPPAATRMVANHVGAECMVLVRGLGSSVTRRLDQLHGKDVRLISVRDAKLNNAFDGRRVYTPARIPKHAYPGLLDAPLETVAVNAGFYLSDEWRERYPEAAGLVVQAISEIKRDIRKIVH